MLTASLVLALVAPLRPTHTSCHTPHPVCYENKEFPALCIEYCSRCNWMLRSAWMQQEVLNTFNGTIATVTLKPNHNAPGTFKITLDTSQWTTLVLWDRGLQGRFPEAKELKQKLRDAVDPNRSLGHSDTPVPVTARPLQSADMPLEEPPVEKGSARQAVVRLFNLLRRGQMRRPLELPDESKV